MEVRVRERSRVRTRRRSDPNMFMGYAAIPLYLCSCWLYEVAASPVIEDATFDQLCVYIDANFDAITHPHKKHVDREALASSSGAYLRWDLLPSRIVEGAKALHREINGRDLP